LPTKTINIAQTTAKLPTAITDVNEITTITEHISNIFDIKKPLLIFI